MSFPEWGRSYNALYLPLTSDWQCSLVPARDVQDVDRGWKLSYEERQQARKEREDQIGQDRQDFDRLFRVSINRRAARACSDFRIYVAFISEHLRISGLTAPVDGGSVTRILRDAVRHGSLIPAINRSWRGSRRVARPYGPQSWPKRAPDPKPTVYALRDGRFIPLNADGRLIDHTSYVPVAASSNGKDDWPGAVEIAASALIGRGDDLGNDGTEGDDGGTSDDGLFSADSGGDSQPFELGDQAGIGDVQQDAGVFLTPAEEAECEMQHAADLDECSAWYAAKPSSYGMCMDRAMHRYATCLRGQGSSS
jgi:hypothetical protein